MGKLIAGGDSFTFGSELQDCYRLADPEKGIPEPYQVVSNLTYSALIAKELNLQYIFCNHQSKCLSCAKRVPISLLRDKIIGTERKKWFGC